ncbi:MAG: NusG domain II-containing protein [Ruminococcus sp.]|uniref:NusG domain II-containing protein n=1 Tax=Ruminococcus sp. TaxID=41978 RepID=UPI0028738941|nr:NusG domain II-containing protein [Ruminococcus sp.]MBQ3285908.1 NusG domain II-containing protein [Ruminococcus sp.]
MKKKGFLAVIIIIFLLGIAGSAVVLLMPSKSHVRITSGGKEVYTADLSAAEDTFFDVPYQGHVNTVEIKDHKIRVKDADCPDQTCVRMGWLNSSAAPIVCLPHKLVIEFTDGEDVDAVTR